MKNRDFIIVSLNPWYTSLSSTSKHVALELSRNNRVLYVNPPLDRKTVITRQGEPLLQRHLKVIKGDEDPLVEIGTNIWNYYPNTVLESINWIPNTKVFSWFNRINNKRLADNITPVLKELGFSRFILINDKDLFRGFYLKELLRPEIYLYYDRDYILGVDYWRRHGLTLEPELARKSDLIVTHSDHLMSLLKPYNPNIYNVGSGVDIELFDAGKDYDIPQELQSLTTPLIGYVGALTSKRLDIEAFIRVATAKPEWTLILVGPEDTDFQKSRLHEMKNVLFCGSKNIQDVPAYISAMNVCLNLQVINDITVGNYPLKIDEYLAMGKPVVATQTVGMRPFEDHVYMTREGGDYVSLIEKAITEDNMERKDSRISFARSHSWKNILDNIYEALQKTLTGQNGSHN